MDRPPDMSINTTRQVRPLTRDERRLADSVFGDAIDYERVTINRRRWWPFQPRCTAMAPDGHLWFHPRSPLWCDDFSCADLGLKSLFIHEMTHVWQAQKRGRWWLPLMRHPFCRYAYAIRPGRAFENYGIEQQAEIVRHAFLLRQGAPVKGAPDQNVYDALLPFTGVT